MKTRLFYAGVAFALGTACSLPAQAQVKPETLLKQRQAAMILQGKYFGPLAGMASGKVPYDANAVQRNAAFLDNLSKMAWDGFAPSTRDEKSRALPVIFTDTAKFKQAQDNFQAEATKLAQLSKSGDEAAVKAQINAVNKTCAACHDDFRQKQ
jgi:cytochrome c556